MRSRLALTAFATLVAIVVAIAAVEVFVRLRWDERRGTPGFYLSDPVLGQRLSPGYDGWFAGVPVKINSLGFRDTRDYALDKSPKTFRILVLGDSVTFGHGALSDTTYPYLLEQELKKWRADIDWQVWNLGVPGYNTTQELLVLKDVGPRYKPDLVIVGFFENDLSDNVMTPPTAFRRMTSAVQRTLQRWFYSYELYKKVGLTLRYRLMTTSPDRARIAELSDDEALLSPPADRRGEPAQQLTAVDRFDSDVPFTCGAVDKNPNRDRLSTHLDAASPDIAAWKATVAELQRMNRSGEYRIAFFINMAPNICPDADRFFDGGALEDEASLRAVLGAGTPVGSSVRAFLPYRPTQMPGASGHSIGNANRVKAEALFEFLRESALLTVDARH